MCNLQKPTLSLLPYILISHGQNTGWKRPQKAQKKGAGKLFQHGSSIKSLSRGVAGGFSAAVWSMHGELKGCTSEPVWTTRTLSSAVWQSQLSAPPPAIRSAAALLRCILPLRFPRNTRRPQKYNTHQNIFVGFIDKIILTLHDELFQSKLTGCSVSNWFTLVSHRVYFGWKKVVGGVIVEQSVHWRESCTKY